MCRQATVTRREPDAPDDPSLPPAPREPPSRLRNRGGRTRNRILFRSEQQTREISAQRCRDGCHFLVGSRGRDCDIPRHSVVSTPIANFRGGLCRACAWDDRESWNAEPQNQLPPCVGSRTGRSRRLYIPSRLQCRDWRIFRCNPPPTPV